MFKNKRKSFAQDALSEVDNFLIRVGPQREHFPKKTIMGAETWPRQMEAPCDKDKGGKETLISE